MTKILQSMLAAARTGCAPFRSQRASMPFPKRPFLLLTALTAYPLYPRQRAPAPILSSRTLRRLTLPHLANLALTTDLLLGATATRNTLRYLGFRIPWRLDTLISHLITHKSSLLPDAPCNTMLSITSDALPHAREHLVRALEQRVAAVELDLRRVGALCEYGVCISEAAAVWDEYQTSLATVSPAPVAAHCALSDALVAEMHEVLAIIAQISELAAAHSLLVVLRTKRDAVCGATGALRCFALAYPTVRYALSVRDDIDLVAVRDAPNLWTMDGGGVGVALQRAVHGADSTGLEALAACVTGVFASCHGIREAGVRWSLWGVGDLQRIRLRDLGVDVVQCVVAGEGSVRLIGERASETWARQALAVEAGAIWTALLQRIR